MLQVEPDSSTDFPPKKKPTRLAIGELQILSLILVPLSNICPVPGGTTSNLV